MLIALIEHLVWDFSSKKVKKSTKLQSFVVIKFFSFSISNNAFIVLHWNDVAFEVSNVINWFNEFLYTHRREFKCFVF